MSNTVQGIHSAVQNQGSSISKGTESDTKDLFAKMIRNLQQGAPATGYGDENGTTLPDGSKVTIMRQTLSDGSVLITVRSGDKILSQTRTHPAQKEKNPHVLHTDTDLLGTIQHDRSICSIVQGEHGEPETMADRFNTQAAAQNVTVGSSFDGEA